MKLFYLLMLIMPLSMTSVFAQFTDSQKSNLHIVNEFSNGGGEYGKINWSETGSGTLSTDTSTKLRGKASIKFVSSGSNDYVSTSGVSCKQGPNCMARFYYKTTSSNLTAAIYDGSNNLIVQQALAANTEFAPTELTFTAATPTTTYSLRVIDGNAGADTIYLDELFIGKFDSIGLINLNPQGYDISAYLSSSPSISSVNAAYAVFTKTRNGDWWMKAQINITASSGNTSHAVTFSGVTFATNGGGNNQTCATFYPSSTSSNCYINSNSSTINVSYGASISVINFFFEAKLNSKPSWVTDFQNEQVVSAGVANQYSGVNFNSASCSFATTSGSYAVFNAGGCTGTLKGIATAGTAGNSEFIANGLLPGEYRADFSGIMYADSGTNCSYDIYDGTNSIASAYLAGPIYGQSFFGVINYSSIQASKTFQIRGNRVSGSGSCRIYCNGGGNQCNFILTQVAPRIAAPQIINSVFTSNDGQNRIEAAMTNGICTSGTCSIATNSGGISSITYNSTGNYNVNFITGTFSSAPTCLCTLFNIGFATKCLVQPNPSTSSANILTRDNSGTSINDQFSIMCFGTK